MVIIDSKYVGNPQTYELTPTFFETLDCRSERTIPWLEPREQTVRLVTSGKPHLGTGCLRRSRKLRSVKGLKKGSAPGLANLEGSMGRIVYSDLGLAGCSLMNSRLRRESILQLAFTNPCSCPSKAITFPLIVS